MNFYQVICAWLLVDINVKAELMNIFLGDNAELPCDVNVDDNVDIQVLHWIKGSSSVVIAYPSKNRSVEHFPEKYKLLGQTTLYIINARINDEGIYQCKIISAEGVRRGSPIQLKVTRHPSPTPTPTQKETTESGHSRYIPLILPSSTPPSPFLDNNKTTQIAAATVSIGALFVLITMVIAIVYFHDRNTNVCHKRWKNKRTDSEAANHRDNDEEERPQEEDEGGGILSPNVSHQNESETTAEHTKLLQDDDTDAANESLHKFIDTTSHALASDETAAGEDSTIMESVIDTNILETTSSYGPLPTEESKDDDIISRGLDRHYEEDINTDEGLTYQVANETKHTKEELSDELILSSCGMTVQRTRNYPAQDLPLAAQVIYDDIISANLSERQRMKRNIIHTANELSQGETSSQESINASSTARRMGQYDEDKEETLDFVLLIVEDYLASFTQDQSRDLCELYITNPLIQNSDDITQILQNVHQTQATGPGRESFTKSNADGIQASGEQAGGNDEPKFMKSPLDCGRGDSYTASTSSDRASLPNSNADGIQASGEQAGEMRSQKLMKSPLDSGDSYTASTSSDRASLPNNSFSSTGRRTGFLRTLVRQMDTMTSPEKNAKRNKITIEIINHLRDYYLSRTSCYHSISSSASTIQSIKGQEDENTRLTAFWLEKIDHLPKKKRDILRKKIGVILYEEYQQTLHQSIYRG